MTEINEQLLGKCKSLEYIVIPKSVTDIMYSAFKGCTSLKSIYIANSEVVIWGSTVFRGCLSLQKIYVPRGAKVRFAAMFALKDYVEIIEEIDFTDLNNIIQNY